MKRTRSPYAIGIALLVTVGLSGGLQHDAQATPQGYTFTKIATLGDPAPGGGSFVNDFEPGGLNSQGDIAFGADVSIGASGQPCFTPPDNRFCEGVFLRHNGQVTELGRADGDAPGGGMFEGSFLGPVGLNDRGDMVFAFLLQPFTQPPPFGVNAGAYRYSHTSGKVTPVVIPYVTPAPGFGTPFQGVFFQPTINHSGDVVFAGIVKTSHGVHPARGPYPGLGLGIFGADANGQITKVVVPGDWAPGGGKFDYAVEPWVNDGGDVSFIGHITGEKSAVDGFPPQEDEISALGGLYVKQGRMGNIITIVHPSSKPGTTSEFRQVFHDVMNNRGDIAFNGDITPLPNSNQNIAVFLYSGGKITAIARPGDTMPSGGNLLNASIVGANVHINDAGDVVFSGVLDTGMNVDGVFVNDTGLYQWSDGQLPLRHPERSTTTRDRCSSAQR